MANSPMWLIVLGLFFVGGVAILWFSRRNATASTCGRCSRALPTHWTRCSACGWVPLAPLGEVEFVQGPLEGKVFRLTESVTSMGSADVSTIVVADDGIARKHIGIRRDIRGYELADLGSPSGVFVNGERMARRLLATGDVIRIGTSEMVFRMGKVE